MKLTRVMPFAKGRKIANTPEISLNTALQQFVVTRDILRSNRGTIVLLLEKTSLTAPQAVATVLRAPTMFSGCSVENNGESLVLWLSHYDAGHKELSWLLA